MGSCEKAEEYIAKQASPQKEILERLRRLFHETLPGAKEEMKWGAIAFGGGKFYLAALKGKVHVGFAVSGLGEEEIRLFEGSGKTMRHIKIRSIGEVDEKKLSKLIRLVDKKAVCGKC